MSITVGTAAEAWEQFQTRPLAGIDPRISNWYGNLSTVPGRGRQHALRFLSLARPGDRMRLDPELAPAAEQIFDHFAATGTETLAPSDIIWSHQHGAAFIGQYNNREPLVFMFDDDTHRLRPNERRLAATRQREDKGGFAWRFPDYVPPTVRIRHRVGDRGCTMTPPRYVWDALGRGRGRLKACLSASGDSNEEFADLEELWLLMHSPSWQGVKYIAQRHVGTKDVGMNYYATDDDVFFLFGSEQQNSGGSSHEANFQSHAHDDYCRPITDQLAIQAQADGLRGFFNFDLRVIQEEERAWVIECNARITAPVYSWSLAMQHFSPWFCVMNFKQVPYESINDLLPQEVRYSSVTKRGVIVHNPGPLIGERACSVTVLASQAREGRELLAALQDHVSESRVAVSA